MQSNIKTAIVIVTYNISRLLPLQLELIRKFCKDDHDIIVVDNSDDSRIRNEIQHHVTTLGTKYLKTNSADKNGSDSHVFACNLSYQKLRDEYDYFLYLDHDIFPLKSFSIVEMLNDKIMAGLGQDKSKTYFWPGCLMWNNRDANRDLINFSVSNELGLDTGGMLYLLIDYHGRDNFAFFNEEFVQNPYYRHGFYNFYQLICDGLFMHFVNSSNWNPLSDNETRINGLLNVLKERVK